MRLQSKFHGRAPIIVQYSPTIRLPPQYNQVPQRIHSSARLPAQLDRLLTKKAARSGISKNAHICLALEAYLRQDAEA